MAGSPGLRAVVYWDDTGMWSYRQETLKPFEQVQALGRADDAVLAQDRIQDEELVQVW